MIRFHITPACLVVPWVEVVRVLGREWAINAEDDAILRAAVVATPGAPTWAAFVGGWPSDEGWCLQSPPSVRRRGR